jgi:predicted nucleic acid-binding protein
MEQGSVKKSAWTILFFCAKSSVFKSSSLGSGDAIIAATAVENKMTLASRNVKHFKVIKDLRLEAFKP